MVEHVDWERVTAERHPDDPHTMKPVRITDFGYWQRECSCGWNLATPTRERIMAASARHRRWVAFVRRMARKDT
jgi:hypothetical protein